MTPVLRYRDPTTAARWLCNAFGFRESETAREPSGDVRYILLRLAESSILVRPVSTSGFDDLMVQPSAVGGGNTHVLYHAVSDAQAHCARAKTAGAKVEIEPQDDGLGGYFYTCRDPEGHLWSFGTNTYGAAKSTGAVTEAIGSRPRRGLRTLAVILLVIGGWMVYAIYTHDFPLPATATAPNTPPGIVTTAEQLEAERTRRLAAEKDAADAAAELAAERTAMAGARQALQRAEADLARTRQEKEDATKALASSVALAAGQKAELDRERRQRQDALERLASSAEASARQKADAERERRDKDEATKALAAAQQEAAEQKAARERAEALLASVREEAAREQAVHAAAGISATADAQALQERVMELERTAHIQKEELEAARQALADARTEIEGLHTAQREAARDAPPTTAAVATAAPAAPPNDAAAAAVPTALAPPRPRNPCGQALQGKVPTTPRGSRTWSEASLARLCKGAEASAEPARCYEELMRGKVRWGKGNTWTVPNAVILCAGTHNARETLDCFASSVTANEGWSEAINKCRTAKP